MPPQRLHDAISGRERLWRVWWLWSVPVALAASALTLCAEFLRLDGMHAAGALLDTVKVLVYAAWAVAAWRCAPNVQNALWCNLGRAGVALGVLLVTITS